jgi:hypothetical protein
VVARRDTFLAYHARTSSLPPGHFDVLQFVEVACVVTAPAHLSHPLVKDAGHAVTAGDRPSGAARGDVTASDVPRVAKLPAPLASLTPTKAAKTFRAAMDRYADREHYGYISKGGTAALEPEE